MDTVKIKIFCPIYRKDTVVYLLRFSDGQILFNGCEDCCGSETCKECRKKSLEIATEELKISESLHH